MTVSPFAVADEPTTALDVVVQSQILDLLATLRKEESLSIILITHDLGVIWRICDRVGVMYAGKLVEIGDKARAFKNPSHPYTQALLACVPKLGGPRNKYLASVPGEPPKTILASTGCRFIDRCPKAMAICTGEIPEVTLDDKGTRVLCTLYANQGRKVQQLESQ